MATSGGNFISTQTVLLLATVFGLPLITSRSISHMSDPTIEGQLPLDSNQALLPNSEKEAIISVNGNDISEPVWNFQALPSLDRTEENTNGRQSRISPTAGQAVASLDKASAKDCKVSNTMCNCSYLNWTTFPDDFEVILSHCTYLNLTKNNLTAIPHGTFKNFTVLGSLEFEQNEINRLYADSFRGLSGLHNLTLWGNRLVMTDETFPDEVFTPLKSLKWLNIANNSKDTRNQHLSYPDVALSKLKNLETLVIDGLFNKTFGDGFRLMTSLRNLTLAGGFSGYCDLDNSLTNETFSNLVQLTKLKLRVCNISGDATEAGVFAMLTKLKVLDVSLNNNLDLSNVFRIMKAWRNSSLVYLDISYVTPRYATSRHICADHVSYFPQSLEKLYVRGNSIESVDEDVFDTLPKSLKTLDVSVNRFIFGCYLRGLKNMPSLELLRIEGQGYVSDTPDSFPPSDQVRSQLSCAQNCSGTQDLQFVLPPKLTYLSMHNLGLRLNIGQVNVSSNNSLKHVDLSGNIFPRLVGPVLGLHELEHLSMGNSFISDISETFFEHFSSLRSLDLGNNVIGLKPQGPPVFKNLLSLEFLNLSFTAIYSMGEDFFYGLDNLTELHLAENRLDNFKVNLRNMSKLTTLNLAMNYLTSLDSDIRNYIQSLKTDITIDMSYNSFLCNCDNLDFLNWMTTIKAFKKSLSNQNESYSCGNNKKIFIHDRYSGVIRELQRECTSHYVLFLLTLGGTVVAASVVIGLILYRFRWNLRYLYYAAYVSLKKNLSANMTEGDFQYDVFVSYAGEDEDFIRDSVETELESRGLKVFVHGRDFVAGDYIASNILVAIKTCRKTLVVLTKSLLNSKWCNYELQLANMEAVHTGRQVLIFLLKDNLTNRQMGMQLLSYIRTNTYIPYPGVGQEDGEPDPNMVEAFWEKLAKDLKG